MMAHSLRDEVYFRANNQCEYCHMPEELTSSPFVLDHIIARKHDGKTESMNLALSCYPCNAHKGSDIASIDSETGELTRLFNPRTDHWNEHFSWEDAHLRGKTSIGRVTLQLLSINLPARVKHRELLSKANLWKPSS